MITDVCFSLMLFFNIIEMTSLRLLSSWFRYEQRSFEEFSICRQLDDEILQLIVNSTCVLTIDLIHIKFIFRAVTELKS